MSKKTTFPGSVLGPDSTATATTPSETATELGPAPKGERLISITSVGALGLERSTMPRVLGALLVKKTRLLAGSKATVSALASIPVSKLERW